MINFHNIEISVSGVKLLAQSASIDQSNSLSPAYAIGYRGSLQLVPNGPIKNSINFSYLIEPGTDVSAKLIDRIRNYDFNSFPTKISAGGFTGMGYLSNFSLDIKENDAISASAQYDIFTELTGQLNNQDRNNFYSGNISGIGHYFTTYAKSSNGLTTGSILNASYSFQNNWQPIFKIGGPAPIQVKFISAIETFNFTHEYTGLKITHSGQNYQNTFNDFDVIEINPLSKDWTNATNKITLYLGSGKINSNKIDIQENSLILSDASIIKYY